MSQLVIFTDATGLLITEGNCRPNPYYSNIHEYTENGWVVMSVTGTGIASMYHTRGSFCMVLEKPGTKFPMP